MAQLMNLHEFLDDFLERGSKASNRIYIQTMVIAEGPVLNKVMDVLIPAKKRGVDDKRFILDVDVGINALVMQDTPRSSKRTWGWLAYMKHAIHWIFSFNSAKFHVTIDGKEIYTRATDVMIANGGIVKFLLKRIAGYNPSPKPHFEVIFTKIRGKRDYLRYLLSFILGSLNKDPGIDVYRVDKEVTIRCQRPLPVQGDGDIIGKVPVTVTILKNAVTVIVPNT